MSLRHGVVSAVAVYSQGERLSHVMVSRLKALRSVHSSRSTRARDTKGSHLMSSYMRLFFVLTTTTAVMDAMYRTMSELDMMPIWSEICKINNTQNNYIRRICDKRRFCRSVSYTLCCVALCCLHTKGRSNRSLIFLISCVFLFALFFSSRFSCFFFLDMLPANPCPRLTLPYNAKQLNSSYSFETLRSFHLRGTLLSVFDI